MTRRCSVDSTYCRVVITADCSRFSFSTPSDKCTLLRSTDYTGVLTGKNSVLSSSRLYCCNFGVQNTTFHNTGLCILSILIRLHIESMCRPNRLSSRLDHVTTETALYSLHYRRVREQSGQLSSVCSTRRLMLWVHGSDIIIFKAISSRFYRRELLTIRFGSLYLFMFSPIAEAESICFTV